MTPRYSLAPLARRDMREIWTYSASRWNGRRADTYIRDLTRVIELIAADPRVGVICDEIRPGYRRHPFGSHVLFYVALETGVVIMRVLHQQMDAASRL